MTARIALLAFVAFACGAVAARADDKRKAEKKYDVRVKPVWKAGDTYTTTRSVVEEKGLSVAVADMTGKAGGSGTSAVRYTAIVRVDAVGTDGVPTKRTIHFTKWSSESGAEPDTTIEGSQVEVTGLGAERDWQFLGDAPVASDVAMNWLNAEYGHEREGATPVDPFALFATKAPVAVGATWEVDPNVLAAEAVTGGPMEPDGGGKATARLDKVEKGVASVTVQGTLPFKAADADNLKWSKDAAITVKGSATIPLDGRFLRSDCTTEFALAATATVEQDSKTTTIQMKFRRRVEEASTPGGTIPPPPTATAEK